MRIFITGITGTLGTALARLHAGRDDRVWGCSRSEVTAVEWLVKFGKLATHYLCDAAELASRFSDVGRLLPSMDRVYHCAAMKHVDLCEQQPGIAMAQNAQLTSLVALACLEAKVPLVHVSSDKACLPQGVYGATKLLSERSAVLMNAAVVRLGNLVGSSGSVFQLWRDLVAKGEPIKLTDPEMTRYFIETDHAAEFVADRFLSGRVTIPNPLKSASIGDLAKAVVDLCNPMWENFPVKIVGRRPGETKHQWLVAPGEPIDEEEDRLLLGGNFSEHAGWCSRDAERWDSQELFALAGIK